MRDYRDNVLSFQNVHFDLSGTAALAERWRAYNEAVLTASRSRPERFFTLHYEDLLARPEPRLRDMCAFLSVDFEKPMLSFHEDQGAVRDWQANLAVPLDKSRVEGWRERMDPAAVRSADAVCARLGARFGYETADKGAPAREISGRPSRYRPRPTGEFPGARHFSPSLLVSPSYPQNL